LFKVKYFIGALSYGTKTQSNSHVKNHLDIYFHDIDIYDRSNACFSKTGKPLGMFIKFRNKTSKTFGQQFLQAVLQCGALFALAVFFGFSFNQFRDSRLPLFEDWSMEARLITPSGERLDISLIEAKNLFFQQAAIMIDARPNDDYEKGHIKGSRSLPWHEVDRKLMEVTKDIPVDTPIITYCDGETCELSHNLANFLIDLGYNNVRILVNGWTKWQNADLPIDKEDSD
jgi:rhodanese-related sulfurtransferase